MLFDLKTSVSMEGFRNSKGFESLFNLYYSGLVVYANRFLRDTIAAEDVVHDVFMSLWEKRETLCMESAKSYLFSSVRNACLNHIARLRVRDKYQEEILQKGEATGLITWEYYVESELQERIEEAIRRLPPRCRNVFLMSRFDGKTVLEIAEELEISPRTVEKHIEVALKSLRHDLADYLPITLLTWLLSL